eukprot:817-Pelagococcus_subviridis.AAC.1
MGIRLGARSRGRGPIGGAALRARRRIFSPRSRVRSRRARRRFERPRVVRACGATVDTAASDRARERSSSGNATTP